MTESTHDRLEYLRGEIRAERISYGELAELQGLADQIDPGDVELLEWAGVPEFPSDLLFENHGSVMLLRTGTDAGRAWVAENVGHEDWQEYAGGIACEPRYVGPVIEGAIADGLEVSLDGQVIESITSV